MTITYLPTYLQNSRTQYFEVLRVMVCESCMCVGVWVDAGTLFFILMCASLLSFFFYIKKKGQNKLFPRFPVEVAGRSGGNKCRQWSGGNNVEWSSQGMSRWSWYYFFSRSVVRVGLSHVL